MSPNQLMQATVLPHVPCSITSRSALAAEPRLIAGVGHYGKKLESIPCRAINPTAGALQSEEICPGSSLISVWQTRAKTARRPGDLMSGTTRTA